MVQILSTNTFTTAKWIVSATASDGTHTTIAGALTSASAGDTIFVRPGTYTENLTLKDNVHIVSFGNQSNVQATDNVIIVGKASITDAKMSFTNITLQTNSDFAIDISTGGYVSLYNCAIVMSNAGAFNISAGHLYLYNCNSSSTANNAFFTAASTSYIQIQGSNLSQTTTAASTIAGSSAISCVHSICIFPITTSSTAQFQGSNCQFGVNSTNSTSLTIGGTGALNYCYNSYITGGTASAISVGTGATLTLAECVVQSTNTNAITGAGTVQYGTIDFSGSSSTINTTTQTALVTRTGISLSSKQPAFSAYIGTTLSNVTGDGTTYAIIYNTENYDQSSSYDNTTGLFTAPYAGKYLFNGSIYMSDIGVAHTTFNLVFSTGEYLEISNPFAASVGGVYMVNFSKILNLAASATVGMSVRVSGSTKTVDLLQGGGINQFNGYLLC